MVSFRGERKLDARSDWSSQGFRRVSHAFHMGFRPEVPTLHSLALLGVISIRISTRLHADYNIAWLCWLATRVDFPLCPATKQCPFSMSVSPLWTKLVFGLLTKHEVNPVGYGLVLDFPYQYGRGRVEKKRGRLISHLDRTTLFTKGLIIWLSGKFFLRDTAGSPERDKNSVILPARLLGSANHSAGIGLSCPLTELAIW